MRYIKLMVFLLFLFSKNLIYAQLPANDPTWTLKLQDDFNGPTLNTTNWHDCYTWGPSIGNGLEYNSPSNLLFNHTAGFLAIKCETVTPFYYPAANCTLSYQSGAIQSKFQYKYGYWEISAKFPAGAQGYWPAFWLLGTGINSCYTSPNWEGYYHEIDILENGGEASKYYDSFGHNYHWRDITTCTRDALYNNSSTPYFFPINGNISNENKIGMFWEPGRMTWYFNDIPVKIVEDPVYTPDHAIGTILNFAVDLWWPASPGSFPAYFEINWLKIWQLEPDCSTAVSFCSNFNAGTYVSKVKKSISIGGSGCADNINTSSNTNFWATDFVLLDEGTTITDNGSGSFSAQITNCPN